MNFYKHHLGDFASHTAHLGWDEQCAYLKLLGVYYRTELPIPSDDKVTFRLIQATKPHHRVAARLVLSEFFTLQSDGYHNKRCDEEIEKYQAQAEHNRTVGPLGGRPKKTTRVNSDNHMGSIREPDHNPNQNQEPLTINQNQNSVALELSTDAPPVEIPTQGNGEDKPKVTKAGMWAIELRKLNVKTTSMHPTMLQLIEDGFELPSVVEAVSIARQRKPFPEMLHIGYLDTITRNPPKASVKSWYASESATIAKGKELGLEPRPGEEMDQYRDRLRTAGA